jgi:hypothetical protein
VFSRSVVMFLSLSERIPVMRKATVLFVLAFLFGWVLSAHAALEFNADFAQDTAYENSWPMKAGDVVSVDIYVSNVPEPGLIAMGFKLTYDSSKLEVVPAGTAVDADNWPVAPKLEFTDADGDVDEIDMVGFRMSGLGGDNIHLGTVKFRCTSEGTSEFTLLKRGENVVGFVLDCDEDTQNCELLYHDDADPELLEQLLAQLIRDGDIGVGVLLGTIRPPVPGNINGDGAVDLADAILALQFMAKMHTTYIHGNADVNGDGLIDMAEAIYILQRLSSVR